MISYRESLISAVYLACTITVHGPILGPSHKPISHFLHGNTDWRHSSHGHWELLAPLCSYFASFNTRYRLLLVIVLTWIAHLTCCTLKFLYLLLACHHRNYLCCHLPNRGRAGIKLGDVDTSQMYIKVPCLYWWLCYMFFHTFIPFYTYLDYPTNLVPQCQFLSVVVRALQESTNY